MKNGCKSIDLHERNNGVFNYEFNSDSNKGNNQVFIEAFGWKCVHLKVDMKTSLSLELFIKSGCLWTLV
jgi:hypothetical protein